MTDTEKTGTEKQSQQAVADDHSRTIWPSFLLICVVAFLIIFVINGIIASRHVRLIWGDNPPGGSVPSGGSVNVFCTVFIPSSEIIFGFSFIIALSWALNMYIQVRKLIPTIKQQIESQLIQISQISNQAEKFDELAKQHYKFCQLWFTIAITIFLGGIVYAVFHVGSHLCSTDWGFQHINNKDIANIIASLLPNIFVYSLFFASWAWAVRNYRIHWHNFVINENRYSTLCTYDSIVGAIKLTNADSELRRKALLCGALIVLMPFVTGYVAEEQESHTAAERLTKLEELMREFLTK